MINKYHYDILLLNDFHKEIITIYIIEVIIITGTLLTNNIQGGNNNLLRFIMVVGKCIFFPQHLSDVFRDKCDYCLTITPNTFIKIIISKQQIFDFSTKTKDNIFFPIVFKSQLHSINLSGK